MGNAKSKIPQRSRSKKRRDSKKSKSALPESSSAQKTVDPRLPFATYRELFNLKNSWKSVSRNLEETAKVNLLLFFKKYPSCQNLFVNLKDLKTEEEMLESINFENQAIAIFSVFDEAMEFIECVDKVQLGIRNAAQAHSKIPGFRPEFFKDMESTFLEAVSIALEDRFTEPTKENFRKLYNFVTNSMISMIQEIDSTI